MNFWHFLCLIGVIITYVLKRQVFININYVTSLCAMIDISVLLVGNSFLMGFVHSLESGMIKAHSR